MKTTPFGSVSKCGRPARVCRAIFAFTLGLLLAGGWATRVIAQSDDFNDGNDAGWRRSSVPAGIFTFPTNQNGGHSYRLQGNPGTGGGDTNARAFSFMTNRIYTNFFAAVDVVAWNTNQDADMVVGLIARGSSNEMIYPGAAFDPSIPMGLTFNARLHSNRSYVGPTNSGPLGSRDQMSIWGMVNAGGTLMLGNPVAVSQCGFRWVPGHSYRMTFSCTNSFGDFAQFYTCSIYDGNDLTQPLLTMTGDDSYGGNSLYIPPYGYIGVFGYHLSNGDYDPTVDVTFDNFYASAVAPTSVAFPAIPNGLTAAPQVVGRSPVSFKNFHPVVSGITFRATTLTTTNAINTSAIKLFLNGVDVSQSLIQSGPATNVNVSYFGLASNVVYEARIELKDVLGRSTTNAFAFDTFSDTYLSSAAVKTIECEDYDFGGGSFMDSPVASGYKPDLSDQYNLFPVGYAEAIGVAGVDFFDRDVNSHSPENQYRSWDGVGTQQGNQGLFVYADSAMGVIYSQSYDTQRKRFSNVNSSLQDYIVERCEGGEWLNYTRIFKGTNSYNAYLRSAAGLAQPVRLDTIGPGNVTNILGRFNVASSFYLNNYTYTPLLLTNGSRALIQLDGTNTLRLTLDSIQSEGFRSGLSMNYIVLIPAVPQVMSSSQVNGSYTPEANVLVDAGARRITVPQGGSTRFYRVVWNRQVSITGISLNGGNAVLSY